MSSSIYAETSDASSENFVAPNNITIALALNGKILTKTITQNNEVAYDQAYYYRFFNRNIDTLSDLFTLVKVLLYKPQCCVIRGVSKYDDENKRQRRLFQGNDATIIEQNQNWFALDIDGYGECTGDLKRDAKSVLLALGLSNVEALAIPSSGYMRKPGIRIRLFLWNSVKISCLSLKKHFTQYSNIVDTALFHPIQPIYTARPRFIGLSDPCKVLWAWISGSQMYTEIQQIFDHSNKGVEYYQRTSKQAKDWLNRVIREMQDIPETKRHNWLFVQAVGLAKPCFDGVLDEDEVKEDLADAAYMWWRGNRKKDRETIEYAFKAALNKKENNGGQF